MVPGQSIMLFQSFDFDFGCGDTEEAKDLWKRFDGFIAENLTVAASLVRQIISLQHLLLPMTESYGLFRLRPSLVSFLGSSTSLSQRSRLKLAPKL